MSRKVQEASRDATSRHRRHDNAAQLEREQLRGRGVTALPACYAVPRGYHDVLGLDVLMDRGWITTFGSDEKMTVQISFAAQGGSGTPVPDLSIEVDDLEAALERVASAGFPIEYGPVDEPWGVRRFYTRDPYDRLINILIHRQD